jgi:tryptophanyl-tRNA synthetase
LEIAKIYLAAGIDPKKSSIFIQSQISEHAELMWILNTITRVGDLLKMTQLKDKAGLVDGDRFQEAIEGFSSANSREEVVSAISSMSSRDAAKTAKELASLTVLKFLRETYIEPLNKSGVGLFDYPVLMAADIILYGTEVVPVGEDQKQHVELARDLAKRFNQKFGETFIIPQVFIREEGMRVMGLDDPTKKMSKSAASEYNYIALVDDAETVKRKIKKAVTDSGSEIVYSEDKPALKNLINIYSSFSGKSPKEIEALYTGKGYGDFKTDLAEVIIAFLEPFQQRYNALSDEEVMKVLEDGAEKVRPIAKKKMDEVKKKVGFLI